MSSLKRGCSGQSSEQVVQYSTVQYTQSTRVGCGPLLPVTWGSAVWNFWGKRLQFSNQLSVTAGQALVMMRDEWYK
jgi:hypothetical protein